MGRIAYDSQKRGFIQFLELFFLKEQNYYLTSGEVYQKQIPQVILSK